MHKTTSQRLVAGPLYQKIKSIMEDSTILSNWTIGNKHKMEYDFSCELYRMSTYSTFPAGVPVSERSLARAGFYYTGVNDKVKCFCCGLMLDNWKEGDNPVEKHKKLYPSCSFIQNLVSVTNLESTFKNTSQMRNSFTHSLSPTLDHSDSFSGSYSNLSPNPLNSRAVEDLSPLRTNPYSYAMSTEEARFLTYHEWPLSFLSPSELARAGFYYIGPGDRVACFACGGTLSNWEPKDDAMSEHRRHFPNCPFLENSLEMLRFTISNLSMQTHAARLRTFMYWPSSVPVQPEQLASAGFYYVGRNDDVKCFCCDGGLRCWESGDDPWVEHAKWFPRCEFLIRMKGQDFVDEIQARYPHLLEQLLSTSETPGDESADPPIVVHCGPGENHSEDAVMMNTPVITAALEMGFNRRLVKQTVQSKILTTGENYKTVSDLVLDLLDAEDEKRQEEKERQTEEMASDDLSLLRKNRMALFQQLTCVLPILDHLLKANIINKQEHDIIKQKTQIPLQARELIDTVLVKGNAAANIFKNCLKEIDSTLYKNLFVEKNMKYVPTEDVSGLSLEEQLRRLQEERTCKVCMDKEVSIVFIPCGHLVVCQECAPSLRKCPICRGIIKGTVRTFLS
ncbi:baculoviral IAP repeat-containing protein 2 isoform X2 [Rhinolophus sinicus]|uniref:baculoviral IAP repeat-containing protein 2 isoform X2 n=1 Tax=Rhinolophus sinicus TaxID=89399 RepID=UPI003D7B8E54